MAKRLSLLPDGVRFPEWEPEYQAALQEMDRTALIGLMEAAEPALLTRRDALQQVADSGIECQAIDEALIKLRLLKKERLHFES